MAQWAYAMVANSHEDLTHFHAQEIELDTNFSQPLFVTLQPPFQAGMSFGIPCL